MQAVNRPMTQAELTGNQHSQRLKALALEMGFDSCRIAKACYLEEEEPRLEQWLREGRHGTMSWMERNFDKRLDPRLLVEGAKSVVTFTYSYKPDQKLFAENELKISTYAYGEDYHLVIKEKLGELLFRYQEETGEVSGRVFVDSAPVLEKAWAARNGSGWIGKHTNLVHPKKGSFFFLAEWITDLELEADPPIGDHCGTCTRCIDACPTDALFTPYQIDAQRCISYLTIELKEAIPSEFSGKMENWIFGCDICQDVCPWNLKFAISHQEPRFEAHPELKTFSDKEWLELTEEVFKRVFKKSAVKRTKFFGLKRNIEFAFNTNNFQDSNHEQNP